MLVGDPGELIEPAPGQFAETVEMRLKPAQVGRLQIEPEQVAQAAIDGIEILSRAIRRDVIGAVFRACNGFRTAFCSAAHDWLGNIGGVADYAQIAAE